jgi:DNA-binding NarL/FixJ family response regulator
VLVVEDEALTAAGLKQVLEESGYRVLGPVARVQEAIDLVQATPPDAAVLDVNLFGQPSFPVAEILASSGIPFLFCTGYGNPQVIRPELRKAPVLTKPVAPDRLVGAVASLLASAAASDPGRFDRIVPGPADPSAASGSERRLSNAANPV